MKPLIEPDMTDLITKRTPNPELQIFYIYVLHSKTFNKIYIGYSSDPHKRLESHNHPHNKGWTRSFKPWGIIHTEEFESKSMAMKREKQLKSAKGRKFIREELLGGQG